MRVQRLRTRSTLGSAGTRSGTWVALHARAAKQQLTGRCAVRCGGVRGLVPSPDLLANRTAVVHQQWFRNQLDTCKFGAQVCVRLSSLRDFSPEPSLSRSRYVVRQHMAVFCHDLQPPPTVDGGATDPVTMDVRTLVLAVAPIV